MVVICTVAATGLINRETRDTSRATDFLQHYRVIEDVIIKGVVPDSDVNYTIESSRLVQFPDRGRSELLAPKVIQIDSKGVKQVLNAESGKYYEENRTVSLTGNVTISVTYPNQSNTIESTTDELTFQLGDFDN